MKQNYDLLFVTNFPAFYKLNLYNEIANRHSVFVIFTNKEEEGKSRNKDFFTGKCNFDHLILNQKTSIGRSLKGIKVIKKIKYKKLIIGGWDNIINWFFAFYSPKRKNALVIESSNYESTTKGLKAILKKIFLKRIELIYASGSAQKKLAENLGYNGNYIITKGVGLFNIVKQPDYKEKKQIREFIYVGRFVPVKNLFFLISYFNEHPNLTLSLIGFGELEQEIKEKAASNIKIIGAVDNKKLYQYYQASDVFILPSYSEPWGLVVEEALNNGLPVVVSDKIGCIGEVVQENFNGVIFKSNDLLDLDRAIKKISNVDYHNLLRRNISEVDFEQIADYQVASYEI